MAGTKTEYPALLAALQPSQAVSVLNTRVKQIHEINEEVAGWLVERRKIEEAYVAGLNRLSARKADIAVDLGVFKTPWDSIASGTMALAEAHAWFADRIKSDVESPIKDQKRDLQSMSSLQSNLASMARDLEKAQRKGASSAEGAASQWESQAPYVFEQLQGLDESRVNQMREALTQLQTHEIDCHERGKASAESGLNALLNVDTPEEVSAFVARTSSEIPTAVPAGDPAAADTPIRTRAGTSSSNRGITGAALAPPARRRETDDQRSEISAHSDDAPKTEKKSRLSGLRRLGTVMSRRKDKEKLEEKPRPKGRNPLRRNSSSAQQAIPESPEAAASDFTSPHLNRRTSGQEEQSVAIPPATNGPATTSLIDTINAPETSRDVPPTTNGQLDIGSVPQIGVRPPSTIVEEGQTSSILADIERAQQEANAASETDNAFNLNIRDKPIQEESNDQQQAAMANVSNTLRASVVPPPARRSGTLRGRRDVRNTMFVQSPADGGNTLFPSGIAEPAPEAVPVAAPAAETTPALSSLSSVSPIVGMGASPIVPSEHRAADTQSIRSAHSMASTLAPGGIKHPDMTGPGLNASIVETSSATFTGGTVSSATVIGEMALVHNGAVTGAQAPHIRLENFAVLEKVAPNPAFVSQLPSKSGECTLDLSQLSRPSVAFKYKIHLNDSQLAEYSPLLLTPHNRTAANQTDVILNYSLNPAFAAPAGSKKPVSLQNVVLVLTLEGAKAISCQSKPPGVFSKEKSLIYWKLGDLVLDPSNTPGKLLARFSTDGEAKTSSVEARWEMHGAGSGLGVSVLGEGSGGASASADPFADAGASSTSLANAREVDVIRRLVGGKYHAS